MEAVLPPRLWRRLLSPPRLSPWGRVLVAGPQPVPLAVWLSELGFEVTAACDDAAVLSQARRSAAPIDFMYVKPGARTLLDAHRYDAAFIQPLASHGDDWLSLESRWVTAGLVSAVRPQGFVMTIRSPASSTTPGFCLAQHDDECWARHLGCFPGRIETVTDSPLALWTRRGESSVIAWQLPPELLSLDDWREFARRGLLTDQRACCGAVARTSAVRRAA